MQGFRAGRDARPTGLSIPRDGLLCPPGRRSTAPVAEHRRWRRVQGLLGAATQLQRHVRLCRPLRGLKRRGAARPTGSVALRSTPPVANNVPPASRAVRQGVRQGKPDTLRPAIKRRAGARRTEMQARRVNGAGLVIHERPAPDRSLTGSSVQAAQELHRPAHVAHGVLAAFALDGVVALVAVLSEDLVKLRPVGHPGSQRDLLG